MPYNYSPITPAVVVELRTALGMTQAQFAQYFGVTPRTVANWERTGPAPNDFHQALMQILRRRLIEAQEAKQQEQFVKGLQDQLPQVLFGIGVIALFLYLFNSD